MKKSFKRFIIAALALAAACLTLVGCFGGKPKTFTKAGMSITLTTQFSEQEIVTQTAYYVSRDSLATALKEEFSIVSGLEDYTLAEYTDLVLANNKFNSEVNSREGKSYLWFTYEKAVNGKDFYYLATTFKSTDAFWLIQFACATSDKEEFTEKFLGWADSVTFTAPSEGQDNV